jgi:predicted Zn finger-like uncharacterized protein
MQIVCPNCTTPYQIATTAVGENGRSVRCVRCRTVWFAAPLATAMAASATSPPGDGGADDPVAAFRAELAAEPPAAEPATDQTATDPTVQPSLDEPIGSQAPEAPDGASGDAIDETHPIALADIPIPFENAPPLVPALPHGHPRPADAEMDNGPPDIESVAARRARAAAHRRRARLRIPLTAAIAALAVLCAGLIGLRKDVVRHAPQLASFYTALGLPVNLRGLAFADVKIGNEIHDGVPVLVVEGLIVSTVSKPVEVPRLRFALRSAAGGEVYAWTAQPSQPELGPFETLPFRSRLASPPADGNNIQVRFFTHRDAVAGLH